ncbi:MAG TPA: PilZ domain-containing protein [Nitrospiria bacterium]
MIEERRKFRRPTLVACLEIKPLRKSKGVKGYAINVSYSGMGLYSQSSISKENELEIKVFYTDAPFEKEFEVYEGQVKWCRKIGDCFAVGVEFKNVDPHSHCTLVSFLEQTRAFE